MATWKKHRKAKNFSVLIELDRSDQVLVLSCRSHAKLDTGRPSIERNWRKRTIFWVLFSVDYLGGKALFFCLRVFVFAFVVCMCLFYGKVVWVPLWLSDSWKLLQSPSPASHHSLSRTTIVMTKTFDLMKMTLVMMVVTLVVVMVLMLMIATPFPGHDVMINQDLA